MAVTFGVPTHDGIFRCFVVLDKSFLQAINGAQLKFYASCRWIVGVPRVLFDEHFRKWDKWRFANLNKLRSAQDNLVLLPSIGEMFRAERQTLKPASLVLKATAIDFEPDMFRGSKRVPELDEDTRTKGEIVTQRLDHKLNQIVHVWEAFKQIPEFQDAKSEDIPKIVNLKREQIRDDREDIRGFYRNHRDEGAPPAELIDEKWTYFRWIQVYLLAGLDFFASYGLGAPFRRETMINELIDLDYLITAILVGGLASRDRRMIDRFKLLRADGVVLH